MLSTPLSPPARGSSDKVAAAVKYAASLEEIAQAEQISVSSAHMILPRALRKLRAQGLILTSPELASALDHNRKSIVE